MGDSIEYTQLVKAFGQKAIRFSFYQCDWDVLKDIFPAGGQLTYIPHTSRGIITLSLHRNKGLSLFATYNNLHMTTTYNEQ